MTRHLVASWIAILKDAGWMSVMGMVWLSQLLRAEGGRGRAAERE